MPNGFEQFASSVGKALETVPDLYNDALKPATQELGKTLSLIPRTVNAALLPLRQWIAYREYNMAEIEILISQKLANTSEEKIVSPEPYVAVPALQAISYTMNSDELRDLYANLLAKSMNIDTKDSVHPSYVDTIKQLSPSDASYFKNLCQLKYRPMVNVLLDFPNSLTFNLTLYSNTFSWEYRDTHALSIDNLKRLGLINIPEGAWYGDDSLYEDLLNILKEDYTLDKYKTSYPDAIGVSFEKARMNITTYGLSFYQTCVI